LFRHPRCGINQCAFLFETADEKMSGNNGRNFKELNFLHFNYIQRGQLKDRP
jgi:hypothetical protein